MAKSRGRGPTLAKDINRKLVYKLIKLKRITSRVELSNLLQLNKNTVNTIVDELIEVGYISEKGQQRTSGAGRKPVIIAFHASNKWSAGIHISGSAIHWAVTDLYAAPLATFSVPLNESSPETVVHSLKEGVYKLLDQFPASQCVGLHIGIPGQLDQSRRIVQQSSHLRWNHVPFADLLQTCLPLPFRLDHSVKLAALGELWHGAGQGEANFIYGSFGNGVGCGIVADGMLMRGENNAAGELGHIVIDPQGPMCLCGNCGCLEAIVRIPAITQRLSQAGVCAAEEFSMPWLLKQLRNRHPVLLKEMEMVGAAIGQALSSVVNLTNPKLIICDGPLMQASDFLFPGIKKELFRRVTPLAANNVTLVSASLYPYAGCIGAAASAIQSWEEEIDPLDLVTL